MTDETPEIRERTVPLFCLSSPESSLVLEVQFSVVSCTLTLSADVRLFRITLEFTWQESATGRFCLTFELMNAQPDASKSANFSVETGLEKHGGSLSIPRDDLLNSSLGWFQDDKLHFNVQLEQLNSEFTSSSSSSSIPSSSSSSTSSSSSSSSDDEDDDGLCWEWEIKKFSEISGVLRSPTHQIGRNSFHLEYSKTDSLLTFCVDGVRQNVSFRVKLTLRNPIKSASKASLLQINGSNVQTELDVTGFVIDDSVTVTIELNPSEVNHVGLCNQGATCYMNVILQSLFHIPQFRNLVYQMPTAGVEDATKSIPLNLQRLFCQMQLGSRPCSTRGLTHSFGWTSRQTVVRQDTQEFCRILLDNLETKMKGTELDGAIARLFGGKCRNYIRCLDVHYQSELIEHFYDLSLQVKGIPDLRKSLQKYVESESLV
jgi:hypothetical protein